MFFGYDNVIANDIAIENGDKVYIVDSGKENGKTDFQVVEAYIITDKQIREEFIRRKNDESVSKGHISDGLSSKFGDKYDNDRGSDTRQKLGQELSNDNEQSQNNEAGISQGNADRGNLNKSQFNLKSNPQISLSKGEIRKIVANYTRPKVFSRKETEMSVNNLIEEMDELFPTEKISLKGKSKEEAIQMLWQSLNTVNTEDRQAFAEKVAEYIIKNSIVELFFIFVIIYLKGGVFMKKIICLMFVLFLIVFLCSCKINWFNKTLDVSWYYVAIPCVVIFVLAYILIFSQTYVCPNCKTEFKPKWYQLYTTIHFNGKRIAKCPNCKRRGYCEVKGKKNE